MRPVRFLVFNVENKEEDIMNEPEPAVGFSQQFLILNLFFFLF